MLRQQPGDAAQDWDVAGEIAQSRRRRWLFASHYPLLRLRVGLLLAIAQVFKFFFWEIPRWFLFTLPNLDWIRLLAVPLVIAATGSIVTGQLQKEANLNQVLKEYFEQLETLIFTQGLLQDEPGTGAIVLARGRTVAAMRELDLERRTQLIAFLQASGLTAPKIHQDEAIISFSGQNLSEMELRGTDLSDTNFTMANLQAVDLSNANLERSHLHEAELQDAKLKRADLIDADLSNVNLSHSQFDRANLENATLSYANLKQASLKQANLIDTDLRNANLSQTNLSRANLTSADLSSAFLKEADLRRANLSSAELIETNLTGANLRRSLFTNAFLIRSNLSDADLAQAKLSYAIMLATDLRHVQHLTPQQLTGELAPYLCNVALPSTLDQLVDPDRDCAEIPNILVERSQFRAGLFNLADNLVTIREARRIVDEARQKQWD